jgi:hypothetical protein
VFVLLQTQYNYFEKPDPTATYIGLAVFAAIALVLIFYTSIVKKNRAKRGGKKRFKKGAFKRQAAKVGLSKKQTKNIENLLKTHNVENPMRVFDNSAVLDSVIANKLNSLENAKAPPAEKEKIKYELFQLKRLIERSEMLSRVLNSTRQLRLSTKIELTHDNLHKYETIISANLKKMFAVEVPKNDAQRPVRWPKGTKLVITYLRDDNEIYTFNSRVLGYSTVNKVTTMLLAHAQNVKQSQNRMNRRKELDRPVYFYPVVIVESGSGRKKEKKAVVQQNRRHLGTLLDVSAGGCSIKSSFLFNPGALTRVDFETGYKSQAKALGKIQRIRKTEGKGGIMHIQFTRVSRNNMNKIQSFVYGYTDEEAPRSFR